jgi:hypothetical protein
MGEGAANRLERESSPYLLAHADNPVEWFAWRDEALERSRSEDRPIFLSIGYHTCHWCHVMERESFSDPAIAELMNRHFVNIKVDREERPELDEIYMTATQILAGQGGWPNSVFLTPDLKPFFAGTYFPPADRQGMPGFPTVLRSLADAWVERRSDVEAQAEQVATVVRRSLEERELQSSGPVESEPEEVASRAIGQLEGSFDPRWGGFGGAPKFPTPSRLLLLAEAAPSDPRAETMLATTLDRMARGGLFDQLGGGFHRYATDREWKIPHFEKMLYDNGLLLEIYARRAARTGERQPRRVVEATVGFLEREMRDPESGAFWSALDADSDGREGAYYVWTRDELYEALGEEDFGFLAPLLGFDAPPFFEADGYVLHVPVPLADQARRRRLDEDELVAELDRVTGLLRRIREGRQRPATDDKVLADWNGMAVAGLATAGRLLGRAGWVELAAGAARAVLGPMRPDGELRHSRRAGRLGPSAFLSDYVWVIHGLLALDAASPDDGWREAAIDLAAEQERRLAAPEGGYFAAAAREDLLARSREVFDGAIPAANAVACWNWVELGRRTGEPRWRDGAARLLEAFGGLVERHAGAGDGLLVGALRHRAALDEREVGAPGRVARTLEAEARRALEVSLDPGEGASAGEWRELRLRLVPAAGWRIAGPLGAGPPELVGRDLPLEPPEWPSEAAEGLSAPVTLTLRVGPRRGGEGRLILRYGACDRSRCLPPVHLELPVPQ